MCVIARVIATVLLAGSALTGVPAAGLAADMPVKAPPAVAVAIWQSCYIGVQGGYGFGRAKGDVWNAAHVVPAGPFNFDIDGGIGGGHVGCQLQSGQWVFGIEGDLEAARINGDVARSPSPIGGSFYDYTTKVSNLASVRGRLGVAMNQWLLYATGGFASARVQATYAVAGLQPFHTDTGYRAGWTAGGGAEYLFTQNLSARIEYRYTHLRSDSWIDNGLANGRDDNHRANFHAIRGGLSWHFGGGPVVARY